MEYQDFISMSDIKFENSSNSTVFNFTMNQTIVRDLLENHLLGHFKREESVAFGLVVLYIPAFLAGLLGNGFLTVIILSKQRLRNITNLFLCNLTIADLSGKFIILVAGRKPVTIWILFLKCPRKE